MLYRWAADLLVLFHLGFVLFVVLGGLLVLRRPRLAWLHVPAALWGVWIEFSGRVCPLTPLENQLRRMGGEAGYSGGFIDHYVVSLLYPEGLSRGVQLLLGVAMLVLTVAIYLRLLRRAGLPPWPPRSWRGDGTTRSKQVPRTEKMSRSVRSQVP